MSHELYRAQEKKKHIQVPEWKETPEEKRARIEDRIRELEYALYPEGTNIITLPKGFNENDFEKMEKEYLALIDEYKNLYGII